MNELVAYFGFLAIFFILASFVWLVDYLRSLKEKIGLLEDKVDLLDETIFEPSLSFDGDSQEEVNYEIARFELLKKKRGV